MVTFDRRSHCSSSVNCLWQSSVVVSNTHLPRLCASCVKVGSLGFINTTNKVLVNFMMTRLGGYSNYCLVYVISFFVIRLFQPQTGCRKVSESEKRWSSKEFALHSFVQVFNHFRTCYFLLLNFSIDRRHPQKQFRHFLLCCI